MNKEIKKTLPTVTVALSAFNEETNIGNFIASVLKQKEEGFILEKILVVSDGSTDKTVEIVKSFDSPKLEFRDCKERTGKSIRLNEIYSELNSDILVQSDADIIFSHSFVIKDIIAPIVGNSEVGMCGGNPRPVEAVTFTEKAVNCTFEAYTSLRGELRGGDNIFSADGRLLAYKKELVKKIFVPTDMIANDAYTYFCCITMGYKYKYVSSAVVLFRSPQNLKDQIRQNTRFLSAHIRMERYFPQEVVKREWYIPKKIILINMARQFFRHPILSAYIFTVNKYCSFISVKKERELNAKWDMAYTTKKPN